MNQLLLGVVVSSLALISCAQSSSLTTNNATQNSPKIETSDASYKIQPGDILVIDVWRVPSLSQKVKVGNDGIFIYPLIGTVKAEGRSVDELRAHLVETLSQNILVNPVVTVVIDKGTQRYFVVGEVKSPGAFQLEERINVYQAIITAGGFTDFGSKRVKILRKMGNKQKVIKVDIGKYERQKQLDPEAEIQPGDTIVVGKKLI